MMKQGKIVHRLSAIHIAGTYIGTILGAGFASGQEVLQFFGFFGGRGFWGISLSAALLAFYGSLILWLAHRVDARSHRDVLQISGSSIVGWALDGLIVFFLFGSVTAMAAGAGATLSEQFGMASNVGRLLLVGIAFATVLAGVGGVVTTLTGIVPVMLVTVFGVAVYTWLQAPVVLDYYDPRSAPVAWWPLSAVLYASYNLVTAAAVLAPLGRRADPAVLIRGGVWGAAILGLGGLIIQLALLSQGPQLIQVEIPMQLAANRMAAWIGLIYTFVLLAAIYTTAVGALYGLAVRLAEEETPAFIWVAAVAATGAFLASEVGFSQLISTLYTFVGFAGLLLLVSLTIGFVRVLRWARG